MKRGVDVEMWGLSLFYYFTVQSHLLCVCGRDGGKGMFPSLLFRSSFKSLIIELKPCIIFTFLIHSGSLQTFLTALFNLV